MLTNDELVKAIADTRQLHHTAFPPMNEIFKEHLKILLAEQARRDTEREEGQKP
jgi:hypothetical protein